MVKTPWCVDGAPPAPVLPWLCSNISAQTAAVWCRVNDGEACNAPAHDSAFMRRPTPRTHKVVAVWRGVCAAALCQWLVFSLSHGCLFAGPTPVGGGVPGGDRCGVVGGPAAARHASRVRAGHAMAKTLRATRVVWGSDCWVGQALRWNTKQSGSGVLGSWCCAPSHWGQVPRPPLPGVPCVLVRAGDCSCGCCWAV